MELENLWDKQLSFTRDVLRRTRELEIEALTEQQRVSITKQYLLSIHTELSEVLGNIDWKDHRKRTGPLVSSNVLEELVDAQKYLWGLMQILGVTSEEFARVFDEKSFVVSERFRMEQTKLEGNVLVVDIDEVLYKHADAFQNWIEKNKPQMVGLSKMDNAMAWEEAKVEFRQSRVKQYGEAYMENVIALRQFKAIGWKIVLMSYRPTKIYGELEYDTLRWLQSKQVPYDRIMWAAYEKHFYLRDELKQATIFIDDDVETCGLVSTLDMRVYNVKSKYNLHGTKSDKIQCVNNLQDVWEIEKEIRYGRK